MCRQGPLGYWVLYEVAVYDLGNGGRLFVVGDVVKPPKVGLRGASPPNIGRDYSLPFAIKW